MLNFVKYLPLLLKFKDIGEIFQEEQGKTKQWWLSKRLIGAVVVFASAIGGMSALNFSCSPDQIQQATTSIEGIVSGFTFLYGLALAIKGAYDAKRRRDSAVKTN